MDVGSTTQAFIAQVTSNINDNIGYVLAFAAGIMVWIVIKKWVFGGTSRV